MVDQQVSGEGGDSGLKAAFGEIERRQIAIDFQEYFLRKVLGIVRRPSETIAEAINPTMVRLDQFRPCKRITVKAPPYD